MKVILITQWYVGVRTNCYTAERNKNKYLGDVFAEGPPCWGPNIRGRPPMF